MHSSWTLNLTYIHFSQASLYTNNSCESQASCPGHRVLTARMRQVGKNLCDIGFINQLLNVFFSND